MNLIVVYTGGVLTILLALFHLRFYKIFHWEKEFGNISSVNKKIFYTIHLALILLFFLLGILILVYAEELIRSDGLALGLNWALSIFWLWRFLWQIFYFRNKKKRGKSFLEIILLLWFFLLFACFLLPVLSRY